MAIEFKLPDLGEGIATGDIKKWLVKKGDSVEEDDPLVEVETDKAVVEIPSPAGGIIQDIKFPDGSTVNVGSVIAIIGEGKVAEEKAPQKVEKGPEKIKVETTPEAKPAQMPVLATPATRMLAKELKVDIEKVKGTGPGGRITDEDVTVAAGKAEAKPPAPEVKAALPMAITPVSIPAFGKEDRIPLKGIRKTISDNMLKTFQYRAQVTIMDDADMTELSQIREDVNKSLENGVKVSYLAFTVKACVTALRSYPYLNASIDDEKNEIVMKHYYNIGIAVDTQRGLIVPVIKDADKKSIFEISKEIKDLALRGRDGKISVEEMKGNTFTIANIGSIGGLFSTPALNYPDSAILEMQQIRDMPRVVDGEIRIRKVMNLSLTIDHRLVDGGDGQRFMNSIKKYLENPRLLLIGMV
jgi:pyruvate dehydrogenase E2 component (dihydrolipoamide acetyltransferase)